MKLHLSIYIHKKQTKYCKWSLTFAILVSACAKAPSMKDIKIRIRNWQKIIVYGQRKYLSSSFHLVQNKRLISYILSTNPCKKLFLLKKFYTSKFDRMHPPTSTIMNCPISNSVQGILLLTAWRSLCIFAWERYPCFCVLRCYSYKNKTLTYYIISFIVIYPVLCTWNVLTRLQPLMT